MGSGARGEGHSGTVMRAYSLLTITIPLLYLTLRTEAYEARGYTDTSDGYCEGDYGTIPVGGTGYNDERCERILCRDGMYTIQGCGVVSIADMPPDCKLVGGPGHYPNCCKTIVQCDDDNEEDSNDNNDDDNDEDSNDNNDDDNDEDSNDNKEDSNDKNDDDNDNKEDSNHKNDDDNDEDSNYNNDDETSEKDTEICGC
ncbi:hypothetical protein AVEN_267293-1 [Araneus ventricosus]|uniref:Single domain-containing protein n=1 Tax=Araneus ventricosus TaxID=182803 RepID=A0A4Y2DM38_ARAVE|nr:hypothetical protein AVEN_267293-1 [Araneus ventricosus]